MSTTVDLKAKAGTDPIAMFLYHVDDGGISVDVSISNDPTGEKMLDPTDPVHGVALYVQNNFLEILPRAALWLQHRAAEQKKAREAANEVPSIVVPGHG